MGMILQNMEDIPPILTGHHQVKDNHRRLRFARYAQRGIGTAYHEHFVVVWREEALIEYHHPDLILLDLQLPDMSVIRLIEKVRAHPKYANIAIIVISGEATVDLKDLKQRPFTLVRREGITPNDALHLIQSALNV